jgi:hypothetical protein
MKRAEIKKGGVVTNSNQGEEAELLAWIEQEKAKGSFGQNDEFELQPIIITPAELDENGNVITPAVYEMEDYLDDMGATQQRIKMQSVQVAEAEYEVVITDITAEAEMQDGIDVAFNEIAKGVRALAIFKARLKAKGLTPVQIGALFSDAEILKIISALNSGAIDVSKALVAAYVADGTLVSEADKTAVLAELNA